MLSIEASTDVFLRKNLPDGDSYLVGLEFRCGDAWDVTLMVLNSTGDPLAQVSKPVRTADCSHVVFTFPNGGLALSLGQVYYLRLIGGDLFGWKYTEDGYKKGAASFNGKQLLPEHNGNFLVSYLFV